MGFEINGMMTARPFNGPGWSVERQHSAGCSMRQPFRRWHVLSFFPASGAVMRRESRFGASHASLSPGSLGLYPAKEAEYVEWRGERIGALHLHISPARIADAHRAAGGEGYSNVPYRFQFSDARLASLMGGLFDLACGQFARQPEAESIVAAVAKRLAEKYASGFNPRVNIGAGGIDDLLDKMHGEAAIHQSVSALAGSSGLARSRFYALFRKTLGASPHDYLIRSRLEYAKGLLQRGDLSLAQISAASGFFDQSHFTKAFKARLGLTPQMFVDWFSRP